MRRSYLRIFGPYYALSYPSLFAMLHRVFERPDAADGYGDQLRETPEAEGEAYSVSSEEGEGCVALLKPKRAFMCSENALSVAASFASSSSM
jgi:hypothetical protein